MAIVVFPRAWQQHTDGAERVEVEASDVRSLVSGLRARFPGLAPLLSEEHAVAIDGEIVNDPLLEPVEPDSEVHFLPRLSGG